MARLMARKKEHAGRFRLAKLSELVESKKNPRSSFGKEALLELARTMKEQGVLEPLLVRPKNGKLEVVAGARRYRAAKKAGLSSIPVLVRDYDDRQVLEVQVVENLQREDLTPLEEAKAYRLLMDEGALKVEEIAERVGKGVRYVYQRMELLTMEPAPRKALEKGTISAGHADVICRLRKEDQRGAVDRCLGKGRSRWNGKPTVREFRDWVKQEFHLDLSAAPWKWDDAALLKKAGPCTACPKRAGNMKVPPEGAKALTCTDRACYSMKLEAHHARRLEAVEKEHGKVIRISQENYRTQDGVLGFTQYERIPKGKKSCKSSRKAIFADGQARGQVADVCTDSGCQTHRPYAHRTSPQEKARQRARQEKAEIQRKARAETVRAVLGKIKRTLSGRALRLVARGCFSRVWSDRQKDVFRVLGWSLEETKRKGGYGRDYEGVVERKLTRMKDPEVYRFLMLVAVAHDLDSPGWRGEVDRVRDAAKLFRVNMASVERRLQKELRAKKKAKAKRPKAKKVKKAKAHAVRKKKMKGWKKSRRQKSRGKKK